MQDPRQRRVEPGSALMRVYDDDAVPPTMLSDSHRHRQVQTRLPPEHIDRNTAFPQIARPSARVVQTKHLDGILLRESATHLHHETLGASRREAIDHIQ